MCFCDIFRALFIIIIIIDNFHIALFIIIIIDNFHIALFIIIIIDNFHIALFSCVPRLTALYILQHFLSFTNIIHIIMATNNV